MMLPSTDLHQPPVSPCHDRRRAPRVEILGQIHGELVSFDLPMVLRDLGFGGFSAETAVEFPAGVTHSFRFTPAGEAPVVLTARVTHCRPAPPEGPSGTFITGFEFAHKHAQTREAVDELIDKITSVLNAN